MLTEVLDAMFLVKKEADSVIIQQGDDGDNFYVIDQGQVEVFKEEEGQEPKKVLDLQQGGSFGELALIYNQPRAATVKAKTDVALWAIDQVSKEGGGWGGKERGIKERGSKSGDQGARCGS